MSRIVKTGGLFAFVFLAALAIVSSGQQKKNDTQAKVYVTGLVKRAAALDYSPGLTLHKAVELAGGVRIKKKYSWACVYRKQGYSLPQVFPIRFGLLSSNKHPEFELQEFDIVEVSRDKKACSIYRGGGFVGLPNRTPIPIP